MMMMTMMVMMMIFLGGGKESWAFGKKQLIWSKGGRGMEVRVLLGR
jgi:hypothetical protein